MFQVETIHNEFRLFVEQRTARFYDNYYESSSSTTSLFDDILANIQFPFVYHPSVQQCQEQECVSPFHTTDELVDSIQDMQLNTQMKYDSDESDCEDSEPELNEQHMFLENREEEDRHEESSNEAFKDPYTFMLLQKNQDKERSNDEQDAQYEEQDAQYEEEDSGEDSDDSYRPSTSSFSRQVSSKKLPSYFTFSSSPQLSITTSTSQMSLQVENQSIPLDENQHVRTKRKYVKKAKLSLESPKALKARKQKRMKDAYQLQLSKAKHHKHSQARLDYYNRHRKLIVPYSPPSPPLEASVSIPPSTPSVSSVVTQTEDKTQDVNVEINNVSMNLQPERMEQVFKEFYQYNRHELMYHMKHERFGDIVVHTYSTKSYRMKFAVATHVCALLLKYHLKNTSRTVQILNLEYEKIMGTVIRFTPCASRQKNGKVWLLSALGVGKIIENFRHKTKFHAYLQYLETVVIPALTIEELTTVKN